MSKKYFSKERDLENDFENRAEVSPMSFNQFFFDDVYLRLFGASKSNAEIKIFWVRTFNLGAKTKEN